MWEKTKSCLQTSPRIILLVDERELFHFGVFEWPCVSYIFISHHQISIGNGDKAILSTNVLLLHPLTEAIFLTGFFNGSSESLIASYISIQIVRDIKITKEREREREKCFCGATHFHRFLSTVQRPRTLHVSSSLEELCLSTCEIFSRRIKFFFFFLSQGADQRNSNQFWRNPNTEWFLKYDVSNCVSRIKNLIISNLIISFRVVK